MLLHCGIFSANMDKNEHSLVNIIPSYMIVNYSQVVNIDRRYNALSAFTLAPLLLT